MSIELSMCGHQLGHGAASDALSFAAGRVTFEQLQADPNLWFNPRLFGRLPYEALPPGEDANTLYPWKVLWPCLAAVTCFGKPLTADDVQKLRNMLSESEGMQGGETSRWYHFFSQSKKESTTRTGTSDRFAETSYLDTASDSAGEERGPVVGRVHTRWVLKPSSEQLARLGLRYGRNNISFNINSDLQGEQAVRANIYLLKSTARIIISDVDGTITKSDIMGQIAPLIGKDWAQGGVAKLFTAAVNNGYTILYLSARALGQADLTRNYLQTLKQDASGTSAAAEADLSLPEGPIILSPDRLFDALRREVIERRPHEFKVAALRDIRGLFPNSHNPFYGGFGNRDTDQQTYLHVGVPESRILTINPKGEISQYTNTGFTKTYSELAEMVDSFFPSLPADGGEPDEEYRTFNFWTQPLYMGVIEDDADED
jgi:phosphatidate phosphatase LPIN